MIAREHELVCIRSTRSSDDCIDTSSSAVKYQMKLYGKNLKDGDVLITNSPRAGGSYVQLKFQPLPNTTDIPFSVTFRISQSSHQYSMRNPEK